MRFILEGDPTNKNSPNQGDHMSPFVRDYVPLCLLPQHVINNSPFTLQSLPDEKKNYG